MADNPKEALLEIADMVDGLKEVCAIQSRNELEAIRNRLRHLATRERPLSDETLHLYDEETVVKAEDVGTCDSCGSRLVYRGRWPRSLVCPLGCGEAGP